MKMITSALITLIAAAAFANEPTTTTTAPTDTTTPPAATTPHDKMDKTTPGAKMATAPTAEECTHKPGTKGCDKVKKDTKKTK
ncbi:MAG: hypothetical protein AABY64_14295 [Bdellovibrionota bacterium]